jgi:hypothetical protein
VVTEETLVVDVYACGIEVERPEGDLYEILNIDPQASFAQLAPSLMLCNHRYDELNSHERYAFKVLTNPSYKALYDRTRSTKALFDAGFFDDGLPKAANEYATWNYNFPSVQLDKVKANLADKPLKKSPAVLVTTGGLSPIHNGHLAMMEEARRQVELLDYQVVGGFLAPGHDSYVGQKYGGTANIHSAHRCAMVDIATRDSDWLACDPWPARYMPAELNFTDVVDHLDCMLNSTFLEPIEVFYVYGSDNAGFGAALPNHSIMVERSTISSKLAREGDHQHIDPEVLKYWKSIGQDTGTLPYLIRNEEDEAIGHWIVRYGTGADLSKKRVQLASAVRLGIQQLLKLSGENHKVHLLATSTQTKAGKAVLGDRQSISLDPYFPSSYQLNSTRYFELAGRQEKPKYRAERFGTLPLILQAETIEPGDYVLVEDDVVTGGTIAAMTALLPKDVNIVDQIILSDFADFAGTEYFDVVDMRDFIIGSRHGGLGVILPEPVTTARAPYVLPFVSLQTRAKIPAEMEMELSRVIWQANVRFFTDTGIQIQDCDPGFARFARWLGWQDQDHMVDFCSHYAGALMEIA